MKVLALVTEAFGGFGGIAKYNQDFLAALADYPGCEKITVLPRLVRTPDFHTPARIRIVGEAANSKWRYLLEWLRALTMGPAYDLVICGHLNLMPLALSASRRWRAPLVLLIYGIDAWAPTERRLTDRLVRRVDYFISISEITRQKFLSWAEIDSSRGYVLPNAIDMAAFGPGPKRSDLLQRYNLAHKRVLMTLGRFSADERYKGVDEVLKVMPQILRRFPDLAYMVVGNGSDLPRLQQKARELGVDSHVIFTGSVPESEKADHYRLADVYVMPSSGEGFGFVFLEAMACGIPVVASKRDGSREAVRGGELGAMVDPENPAELAAAIFSALNRPHGVVPEGLEFFSYRRFSQRLHGIVREINLHWVSAT